MSAPVVRSLAQSVGGESITAGVFNPKAQELLRHIYFSVNLSMTDHPGRRAIPSMFKLTGAVETGELAKEAQNRTRAVSVESH